MGEEEWVFSRFASGENWGDRWKGRMENGKRGEGKGKGKGERRLDFLIDTHPDLAEQNALFLERERFPDGREESIGFVARAWAAILCVSCERSLFFSLLTLKSLIFKISLHQ